MKAHVAPSVSFVFCVANIFVAAFCVVMTTQKAVLWLYWNVVILANCTASFSGLSDFQNPQRTHGFIAVDRSECRFVPFSSIDKPNVWLSQALAGHSDLKPS